MSESNIDKRIRNGALRYVNRFNKQPQNLYLGRREYEAFKVFVNKNTQFLNIDTADKIRFADMLVFEVSKENHLAFGESA